MTGSNCESAMGEYLRLAGTPGGNTAVKMIGQAGHLLTTWNDVAGRNPAGPEQLQDASTNREEQGCAGNAAFQNGHGRPVLQQRHTRSITEH
jgi:hypothetical protein